MQQEQTEARILAGLAGIRAPEERLPALAAGLQTSKRLAARLSGIDFGETEPAARFRPPAARRPDA